MADPTTIEIGECPTYVNFVSHGTGFATYWPSSGTAGQHSDGYADVAEPQGVAGDLFLCLVYSNKTDLSLPAGYTEVLNEVWDNVPVSPFNGRDIDQLLDHEHMQVLIGYRILTADQVATSYTEYTGLFYDMDIAVSGHGETIAGDVVRFECVEMGGDYPNVAFPASPVKVGTFDSADYGLLPDPDYTSYWFGLPNVINIDSITPDHMGNHMYLTFAGTHGDAVVETVDDFQPDGPFVAIDPLSTDFSNNFAGTFHQWDMYSAILYAAGKSYFTGSPQFDDGWTAPGTFRVFPNSNWIDGFSGFLHVDYEDWSIMPGIFGVSILIQAPESERPFNDNIADAYENTTCPVVLVECAFGATREVGEAVAPPHLHDDEDTTVWIKWVPDSDQTVTFSTGFEPTAPLPGEEDIHFTEYDTELAIWSGSPGSLTLLASDDDSGGFGTSLIEDLAVTAGTTYYIQVIGFRGDEGRFYLLIDCDGLADYWGILSTVLTA